MALLVFIRAVRDLLKPEKIQNN